MMMRPMAMPLAASRSVKGGKGCGGKKGSNNGIQIPVQIKGNTSNIGGTGKNQGGRGDQANDVGGRNGGGGKPP
jgi:hypothetical protein